MNWKEFLKRELIALSIAIGFSLFVFSQFWWRGKIFIIPKYFFFLSFFFFVLFSILIHLKEYQKVKYPELFEKTEEVYEAIIYKSRWGGLWDPGLAIPYYSRIIKKILGKYDISKRDFWKISLIMAAIWWCIIMSGLAIFYFMIGFIYLDLKAPRSITIALVIIFLFLIPLYYTLLLKRFYWKTLFRLLKKYKKKELGN